MPVDIIETDHSPKEGVATVVSEGFSLAMEGQQHVMISEGRAQVIMKNNTRYKIAFCNTRTDRAMAWLAINGASVGTFLLEPRSRCVIDRPSDRPTPFIFTNSRKNDSCEKSSNSSAAHGNTTLSAVFRPQVRFGLLSLDIASLSTGERHQMDFLHDALLEDAWCEIDRQFGACEYQRFLITWLSTEQDSPVRDVYHRKTSCNAKFCPQTSDDDMDACLLDTDQIMVLLDGDRQLVMPLDGNPSLSHISRVIANELQLDENQTLYYFTHSDRYLCQYQLDKTEGCLFQFFHKDELSEHTNQIVIKASMNVPDQAFVVMARAQWSGLVLPILVEKRTTLLECSRIFAQTVEEKVDSGKLIWIFAGHILDENRTLEHYGIIKNYVMDVMVDDGKQRRKESLTTIVPIAVSQVDDTNGLSDLQGKTETKDSVSSGSNKCESGCLEYTKQQYQEVEPIAVNEKDFTSIDIIIVPRFEDIQDLVNTEETYCNDDRNEILSSNESDVNKSSPLLGRRKSSRRTCRIS